MMLKVRLASGTGALAAAALAAWGSATAAQPAILTLPAQPLERAETCAAYMTFNRAIFLSRSERDPTAAARAANAEARAAAFVGVAHRLGAAAGKSATVIDQEVQSRADQLSELTRDLAAHLQAIAANAAVCTREGDAAPRPPTTKLDPRAEGDDLLRHAGASDLFENLSRADTGVVLRHKASGLVCFLNPGAPTNKIVLFGAGARGDDVGCNTSGPTGVRTWYAKRNTGQTLDQAFAFYVAEVKRFNPKSRPYQPRGKPPANPLAQMLASDKLPANRTAAFLDAERYTSVSVALVRDWVIEFRYSTAPEMAAFAAENAGPMALVAQLGQLAGLTPPLPPPDGPSPAAPGP